MSGDIDQIQAAVDWLVLARDAVEEIESWRNTPAERRHAVFREFCNDHWRRHGRNIMPEYAYCAAAIHRLLVPIPECVQRLHGTVLLWANGEDDGDIAPTRKLRALVDEAATYVTNLRRPAADALATPVEATEPAGAVVLALRETHTAMTAADIRQRLKLKGMNPTKIKSTINRIRQNARRQKIEIAKDGQHNLYPFLWLQSEIPELSA